MFLRRQRQLGPKLLQINSAFHGGVYLFFERGGPQKIFWLIDHGPPKKDLNTPGPGIILN